MVPKPAPLGAAPAERGLERGLDLPLPAPGANRGRGLEERFGGDERRLPEQRELVRVLDQPQLVQDRAGVGEARAGRVPRAAASRARASRLARTRPRRRRGRCRGGSTSVLGLGDACAGRRSAQLVDAGGPRRRRNTRGAASGPPRGPVHSSRSGSRGRTKSVNAPSVRPRREDRRRPPARCSPSGSRGRGPADSAARGRGRRAARARRAGPARRPAPSARGRGRGARRRVRRPACAGHARLAGSTCRARSRGPAHGRRRRSPERRADGFLDARERARPSPRRGVLVTVTKSATMKTLATPWMRQQRRGEGIAGRLARAEK